MSLMQSPFIALFMLWVLVLADGKLALGQSYFDYDPNALDKAPFEIEEVDCGDV